MEGAGIVQYYQETKIHSISPAQATSLQNALEGLTSNRSIRVRVNSDLDKYITNFLGTPSPGVNQSTVSKVNARARAELALNYDPVRWISSYEALWPHQTD